ncbi:N-acetylglucosamine-6-phosphate deacetylase [Psychrobacillus sp. NEAU-3TGS]|uniref:N-acetylglucosamine-6-phosphate deacetylase n=1 Tax=Psychrobacillus sp. NEAU-3TGS TaxID=2995412 RepID=UPI00249943FA|nr:N-acetylglucosamine-6-phosphate deacetylase [Psychrobacillus sp. NEAU-3TGS]MDI2586961.1 N-acetylglucosamine-6-phosphate deacetylase [Psychrobacillus sp. NEAU-3TGS]
MIYLTNATIVLEKSVIQDGFVHIKGEKIESVGKMADCPPINNKEEVFDCTDKQYVIPGMIDIHVHGAGGYDFMDSEQETIDSIALALAEEGTTSYLATTMTNPLSRISSTLKNLASYKRNSSRAGVAEMVGIHLEGPFINKEQKGAQPEDAILPPNCKLFEEWQKLSGDAIKIVTFAPELDANFELLKKLRLAGVIPSMGHTNATYNETVQAIGQGITHATHLFNGMKGLHHRDPGVVGGALLHDEVYVEVIPDGIHFHADLLKLVVRMKGLERILVITDGMRAKGMPDGIYDLGGQNVTVRDGKCLLTSTGSLAGSIVTMNKARLNLRTWLSLTILEQIQVTSINQAKRLGLFDRKGSIQAGKDADIVILGINGEVELTICRGVIAFQCKDAFK